MQAVSSTGCRRAYSSVSPGRPGPLRLVRILLQRARRRARGTRRLIRYNPTNKSSLSRVQLCAAARSQLRELFIQIIKRGCENSFVARVAARFEFAQHASAGQKQALFLAQQLLLGGIESLFVALGTVGFSRFDLRFYGFALPSSGHDSIIKRRRRARAS